MKKLTAIVLLTALAGLSTAAQQLYMPRNVQKAYRNETRAADGRPGKNYWQNTARYKISLSVAPPNRRVTGTEEIVYVNNSPDTLKNLVFRLTLNSHVAEAPRENEVSADYLTSGMQIDEYRENDKPKEWKQGKSTWQAVALDTPLAPKASVRLSFKWHYDVSVESGREGAIDPTTFFIAYFYPRVAVYDDTDGWDRQDFTEAHEFYNDFNDYEFEVAAPKNFVVYATGDLLNAGETLRPEIAARLEKSMTGDDVVHVATAEELAAGKITAARDTLVWKWKASNISDVALAVSDHFVWDAGSVVVDRAANRRASVQAVYDKESKDFERMVEYGKHTLDWCSNNYPGVPYPFPKTTIVRGFADMEFPMMVNDSSQKDPNFTRFVVEHELLHTWFPFYMGINERRYGFMDEGWTTAFEHLIGEVDLGAARNDEAFRQFRVARWIGRPTADADLPIILPGDALVGIGFRGNEYGKPALGYLALKDLLGDAEFKKALHEFMDRWHGKHPLPWDMFNSFNSASGRDLNWFFENWFFGFGYIDLAVGDVRPAAGGYDLTVKNVGGFAAPFDVVLTFEDGTTERRHQTPEVWHRDQKEAAINLPTTKKLAALVLDGGIYTDAAPNDNQWKKR
ncbi:MAG: M1 family metallopeptidase [Acidobacteria bacterium]|nr:M1 family metallopeptidase [Acidobacteriota bacterium]